MAYEIGRQLVIDTTEFEDFGIGLRLPIERGNKSYFDLNYTTIEQAKTNLRNLLQTKKGERLIHTDFGTDLHFLLFEPINEDTFSDKVFDAIDSAIKKWLPYIVIENIDVDLSDENIDRNKINVTLQFKIGKTVNTDSVTFTITD